MSNSGCRALYIFAIIIVVILIIIDIIALVRSYDKPFRLPRIHHHRDEDDDGSEKFVIGLGPAKVINNTSDDNQATIVSTNGILTNQETTDYAKMVRDVKEGKPLIDDDAKKITGKRNTDLLWENAKQIADITAAAKNNINISRDTLINAAKSIQSVDNQLSSEGLVQRGVGNNGKLLFVDHAVPVVNRRGNSEPRMPIMGERGTKKSMVVTPAIYAIPEYTGCVDGAMLQDCGNYSSIFNKKSITDAKDKIITNISGIDRDNTPDVTDVHSKANVISKLPLPYGYKNTPNGNKVTIGAESFRVSSDGTVVV